MFVLVTGASGQLGKSLNRFVENNILNHQFVFATREQLDLSNFKNVRRFIEKNQFNIIINCAAYTSVDNAETEKEQANLVNHLSVKNIAEVARDNHIKLIHISTDYVFDGSKLASYDETDNTSPLNVYGKTKLDGENAILSIMELNAIIIRTSWVYSEHGNNFVNTILILSQKKDKLNIVSDQIGSPTNAKDLAGAIVSIINNKKFYETDTPSEVFHYSNDGECSWYDFAKEIVSLSGTKCIISPIDSKDYPQKALRPKYVLMNKRKIQDYFGLEIHFWTDSLKSCIKDLSASSN
ncbi:MAG: dTDP-4-dehydrorhamnose reductase [Thiotrichales bacterium]|jgi:dTDP-4-dehydrorhamnose reductase|nr:dTDP-4-dehydrorhamnose reductase [Thiotrichales bacterium]